VVSKKSALHLFLFMHVLDKVWYKKLGLEPIDPLPDRPHQAQKQPMGYKNKYDGVGYPIKTFLEESLTRKRNEIMDNFM
jgi:hypothetical protein